MTFQRPIFPPCLPILSPADAPEQARNATTDPAAPNGTPADKACQEAFCGSLGATPKPISGQKQGDDQEPNAGAPITRRVAMTAIAAAPIVVTASIAPALPGPATELLAPIGAGCSEDAGLLELGRQLRAAWAHENEQYRLSDVVHDDAELRAYHLILSPRNRSAVDRRILRWLGATDSGIIPRDIERLRNEQPHLGREEITRVRELIRAHDGYRRRSAELEIETIDARTIAANEVTGAIVARIEATPARTLAGLLVKVEAVRWCRTGDLTDEELACEATDTRLCQTILLDLAAMASGSLTTT
ncbi:hypothetical protein LQG66_27230 [Bradyrhizobium ontarionense]|uniref:DUF222 domain-containing protein n=1 Tax=Bradyrhizobium ontarionense TaxID=2898149 RepID=A0ABY3R6Z1_9BRAD|nr:hypothetical protein [Bradyrhizobium sp. A19]UFZ02923.1 hypothetical protein LQG66_27230 [Bradyrhizobium sp. A19]